MCVWMVKQRVGKLPSLEIIKRIIWVNEVDVAVTSGPVGNFQLQPVLVM